MHNNSNENKTNHLLFILPVIIFHWFSFFFTHSLYSVRCKSIEIKCCKKETEFSFQKNWIKITPLFLCLYVLGTKQDSHLFFKVFFYFNDAIWTTTAPLETNNNKPSLKYQTKPSSNVNVPFIGRPCVCVCACLSVFESVLCYLSVDYIKTGTNYYPAIHL